MRNVFTIMRNAPKRTSAVLMMIAAATIIPAALLAWGPDRPTFTTAKPAGYVTFNSMTNNPAHGDERNFVQVKEASASNSTYAENVAVTPGKEYTVFVYYHNNAASNLNASGKGIAKDVTARAEIPAVVPKGSNGTKTVGFISASNATPGTVWDDASFSNKTDADIYLDMVPGSAKIYNQGSTNGATLPDTITTTGAKLGYNALDGTLPGCHEYAGYVTFNVKATQANFTVEKQVRKTGATTWSESVNVNPGDKIDYMIQYKNTGSVKQDDVVVKDILPKGVSYINGTTKLKNALNPNGKTVSDNLTKNGINISNYTPGSNAYLMFTAQVAKKSELECGTRKLTNKATAETDYGSKSDTADVVVTGEDCPESQKIKVCELDTKKIITIDEKDFDSSKHSKDLKDCEETPVTPPTPEELPTTGPAETVLSIIGLGSLIASIGYYVASRRALLGR